MKNILAATADRDLDTTNDLPNDPNLQGISGEFVDGRSAYFGRGKVNARAAVQRAQALAAPTPQQRQGISLANAPIPDNRQEGIVSPIEIAGTGFVAGIKVEVDITHSYRGDLSIRLISPQGFTAVLQSVDRADDRENVRQSYDRENNRDLAQLASGSVEGSGIWRLHVSDHLRRDVGRLNSWRIDLR